MFDEMKDKLKALAGLAGEEESVEEKPLSMMDKIKARKDARKDELYGRIDSGEYTQEGIDDRERIEESATSGLSQEDKEKIAADLLAKKRKEAGIIDPVEPEIDQENRVALINRDINE